MAGSRYYKIGNIFTRTTGLIKSEALNYNDRPIWYDVYNAFPPKIDPSYDRSEPTNEIRSILYPEDVIRAKFYEKFGSVGTINLSDHKQRPTISQLFVEEYRKLQKDSSLSEEEIWDAATSAIEQRGIRLDRNTPVERDAVEAQNVKIKLSDIFTSESGKIKD